MSIKIAPSILSADFARLADDVNAAEAAGADWIHVDVMDGVFVPNLTIGPPVVAALRRVTKLPLDVHLMIDRPERLLDAFVDAGASILTVHQEASLHLHRTLDRIRQLDVKPGVSVNPSTSINTLDEVLPYVDLVLIMTVNPGFGGQRFIPTSTRKIAALRRALNERELRHVEIEVDGGIAVETAAEVVTAGATVLVAGAAIYNRSATVAENMERLRGAAAQAARP